jgi:hypothetical protein
MLFFEVGHEFFAKNVITKGAKKCNYKGGQNGGNPCYTTD